MSSSDLPTLNIPDAAYEAAAAEIERQGYTFGSDAYDVASYALDAGGRLAVAAELDRIAVAAKVAAKDFRAAGMPTRADDYDQFVKTLTGRSSQLRAGGAR